MKQLDQLDAQVLLALNVIRRKAWEAKRRVATYTGGVFDPFAAAARPAYPHTSRIKRKKYRP